MNVEYHSFYSHHLNREMPFKRYGYKGKVVIVFPSSGGSFYEYEDFKMIEAISWFINNGHIQVFTVDSVDNQAFLSKHKHPHDAAQYHNAFDRYITEEFLGFVRHHTNNYGPYLTTGCSMGAYHALNFMLRHPDLFDTTIALSGVYDVRYLTNSDYVDHVVYENPPVDYLWNLNDHWYLEKYHNNNIIVVTGQGRWEEQSIRDTKIVEDALRSKGVNPSIEFWGFDVDHDWPWWRKQMPYYLDRLLKSGKLY